MKKVLMAFVAVLFVFTLTATAYADCTNTQIGADISVIGAYIDENTDFDTSNNDSWGAIGTFLNLYIVNTYTDNVTTSLVINLQKPAEDQTKVQVELDQAYLTLKEFLSAQVTVQIGKMPWKWELRRTAGAGTLENIYPYGINNAFVMNVNPLAIQVAYEFTDDIKLSFGWGKVIEGSAPGNNVSDFDIYFVRYDHRLGQNSKAFAAILYYNDLGDYVNIYDYSISGYALLDAAFYMLDAGIDYFTLDDKLEMYLEFIWQDGHADTAFELGTIAINAGLEYTFIGYDTTPYIGFDFVYYQGPDGDTTHYVNLFGDNTRTLIAENLLFGGLGGWHFGAVETPGYQGYKLMVGMKSINNDMFAVDFIAGLFQADGDLNPIGRGDGLGVEFDLIISYNYNEDITFTVGIGYFDPERDLSGAIGTNDPDPVWAGVFACTITF